MATAKRSLFSKKPAWLSSTSPPEKVGEDAPIFGRNEQTYLDIVAEEQKRKEKREARTKDRAEQPTNSSHPNKKRRISKEAENDPVNSDSESSRSSQTEECVDDEDGNHNTVTRRTPRRQNKAIQGLEVASDQKTSSHIQPRTSSIIELQDDSDESSNIKPRLEKHDKTTTTRISPTRPELNKKEAESESESEAGDDEYIRELKRKARQKAKLRKLGVVSKTPSAQENIAKSPVDEPRSPNLEPTQSLSHHETPLSPSQDSNPITPAPTDSAKVELLITSSIPNTKPLIVHRRVDQSLQQVKEFWCKKEKFEEAFSAKVFLTWRGTKLFNATTMKGILQRLKNEQGEDQSNGRVQLEAMTPEIYEQKQKERERKIAQEAGLLKDTDDDDDEDATDAVNHESGNGDDVANNSPAAEQKSGSVVIRLIAQDYDPMHLRVRPNTTIDKIMRGFQQTRNIDRDKRCWLIFDGSRLDPESLVSDIEFEDGDEVEVHPR